MRILSKMVYEYEGGWTEHPLETLWAYRSSSKTAIGLSPFSFVYGFEAISLIEQLVPTLRMLPLVQKLELWTSKPWRRHEILPITAPNGISSRWPMLQQGHEIQGFFQRKNVFKGSGSCKEESLRTLQVGPKLEGALSHKGSQ